MSPPPPPPPRPGIDPPSRGNRILCWTSATVAVGAAIAVHYSDWATAEWSLLSIAGIACCAVCYLTRKGRTIEEAYRLGYDVGYERGHRSGSVECWEVRLHADEGDNGRRGA